jgi:hypothetical protein
MNDTTTDNTMRDTDPRRGRKVAAGLLLAVAFVALLKPDVPLDIDKRWLLPLVGAGFIVWAALVRNPGLLVPGGILTGIGAGTLLRGEFGNAAFLFSMAGGFLLISALSLAIFGRSKSQWWTVFPAGGLAFAGMLQLAGPDLRAFFRAIGPAWPYVLIAVAVWLLAVKPKERRRPDQGGSV